jgi:CheY-like chemotaxis protein
MDGYETARALSELPQTKTIPLIGMTLAGNEESTTLAHLRPFCRSVLFKPFRVEQLEAAIGQSYI